ncbi:DUF6850 family outer membrane beta-barrel protein [Myroides sp. DW712]|uniref:DUF6850 family outer membrane beta-barrel protein n=1 Tax=Myroides sp. DW712 TaxID=3389800 RepID=UPI00397904A8
MKHSHWGISLFFFFTFAWTYGQQTDSLALKIKDNQDVIYQFRKSLYDNPAAYLNYRQYNLTSFDLSKEVSKKSTTLAQEGKNVERLFFRANAFNRLDEKSAVWGNASYNQGKRQNIQWNESADYELIFPYVVADSVGGDMKFENYEIQGGYVQQIGKYNIGVSGFYKAKLEYRNVDPRPKNLATQVGGSLGGSRNFDQNFSIGIQLEIEKYTQKHNMSFYSPTGFPVIYEMNGMGNFNNLLKGKRRQAFYDGWKYGTSFQIYETQQNKWFLTGGIHVFNFEKLLPEFYDVQASKAKDILYKLTAGKWFEFNTTTVGVLFYGSKQTRKGTENLFVNETTTNFIKIGQEERYRYEESQVQLSGVWKYQESRNEYSVWPFVGWTQQIERYAQPYSKTEVQSINFGVHAQWLHTFRNGSLLTVEPSLQQKQVQNEKAILTYGVSNAINQMLLDNYEVQIADYWMGSYKIKYDFALPGFVDAFVTGEYKYQHFDKLSKNSSILVSLGITF